jgi:hypothetical protein
MVSTSKAIVFLWGDASGEDKSTEIVWVDGVGLFI